MITGPNGSGKTTLGKMLIGLLRCTSGAILYRGRDLRTWRIAELALEIGYVFQNVEVMFLKSTVAQEVKLSFMRAGRAAEASPAESPRSSPGTTCLRRKARTHSTSAEHKVLDLGRPHAPGLRD